MIQNQSTFQFYFTAIHPVSTTIFQSFGADNTTMKKRKKQNPYPAPSPGKVGKRSARLSASGQDSEGDGGVHFTPPLAANVRTSAVNEISQ